MSKVTLPETNSVERTYDEKNNVVEIRNIAKDGSGLSDIVHTLTYDPDWNKVATYEDPLTNVTTLDYDAVTGQLLSITLPEVDSETPVVEFTYTTEGQLETQTDPTGIVTKFEYSDTDETLESVIQDFGMGRLNLTTLFGYDTAGNVNSVTDPRGNEVTSEWDDNRRLGLVTPPSPFNSLTTEFDYDTNNNRTAVRRATGDVMSPWQTFTTNFDKENKVTSLSDPMTHVTSIGYDELRRVESIEDPELRETETEYDELSRVSTVEDAADNTALTKEYSDNGLLVSLKDARNKETTYEYDGHDRLVTITYPDTTTEEFEWDDNGNLQSFTNRNADVIEFEYDELNRLRVKTPDNQAEVSFEYDLAGRVESVSTSVVSNHPESGEFQYFYDTAGRFIREEMPDAKTVEYDLDENGNVIKITYPDSYYVEREYDELNRLKSISLNGSMTPALEFEYDELSRRRQITADNSVVTEYSYRADNQLESVEHTFDGSSVLFEYTFNDAGECIGQEVDDADFMWHPPSSGTVTYATAADNNTYPTVGGISQSYNSNGCLTADGTWDFGYDTENHLISATDGVTSAAYLYDPMHRLVQKEVGATKTRFIYGGIQRLEDYNGSNDTLQYRYVYGTGLDEVLMRISSGGTITYLHADRAGSIIATSNNTGANTAKFNYGPFGETPSLSGISHGYTGQRFDEETGLYFMKSRFYSPMIGRFLQPDTIGYTNDLHLYAYVKNAPLDFKDPLGMGGELHGYIPGLGYNLPIPIWGPGGGGGNSSISLGGESGSTNKRHGFISETSPGDKNRPTETHILLAAFWASFQGFPTPFAFHTEVLIVHKYKNNEEKITYLRGLSEKRPNANFPQLVVSVALKLTEEEYRKSIKFTTSWTLRLTEVVTPRPEESEQSLYASAYAYEQQTREKPRLYFFFPTAITPGWNSNSLANSLLLSVDLNVDPGVWAPGWEKTFPIPH